MVSMNGCKDKLKQHNMQCDLMAKKDVENQEKLPVTTESCKMICLLDSPMDIGLRWTNKNF